MATSKTLVPVLCHLAHTARPVTVTHKIYNGLEFLFIWLAFSSDLSLRFGTEFIDVFVASLSLLITLHT